MENLDRYFSDAEENISNEFMSANGVNEWDDSFDFGGNEEEYYNASGDADASSSQPYIISLYNSSAVDLSSVVVGAAYTAISTIGSTADLGNTAGLKYAMGISGVTYLEWLWQSTTKPFVVGLTYLQMDNSSSGVLQTIVVKVVDANGNQQQKTLVPTIDPYQNQTDITVLKHTYKFDGFTSLTVNSIATTKTLKIYLFPSETASAGRALTGNSIARGYSNPNVVRQDKIVLGQGVARALRG